MINDYRNQTLCFLMLFNWPELILKNIEQLYYCITD